MTNMLKRLIALVVIVCCLHQTVDSAAAVTTITFVQIPNASLRTKDQIINVTNVPKNATVEFCKGKCRENAYCYALDWNTSTNVSTCSLYNSTNRPVGTTAYNKIGIDHYNVLRSGSGNDTACTKANCTWIDWKPVYNSSATGTLLSNVQPVQSYSDNLNDCVLECTQKNCTGLVWDPLNIDGILCTLLTPLTGSCNYSIPAGAQYQQIYAANSTGTVNLTKCVPVVITTTIRPATATATPGRPATTSIKTFSATAAVVPTTAVGQMMSLSPDQGTPGNNQSTNQQPGNNGTTNGAADSQASSEDSGSIVLWGLAIKPAYIVLAGLGGGCILLVIIAVVALCQQKVGSEHRTTVVTHHTETSADNDYNDRAAIRSDEEIGMDAYATNGTGNNHGYDQDEHDEDDKKEYYNSEEFKNE